MKRNYEFLFERVSQLALETESKYKNNQTCRDNLLEFLDINEWFGMDYRVKGMDTEVCLQEKAVDSIRVWLSGYARKPEEKIQILLDAHEVSHPNTCASLKQFLSREGCWSRSCIWQALDFLFYVMKSDLDIYSEKKSHEILEQASLELSISGMKFLTSYITATRKGNIQWRYTFGRRKIAEGTNDAYEMNDYAAMAYCVFNANNWNQQDMIPKAVKAKKYADVWVFIALHFICALRRTDMTRLPIPSLPAEPKEVKACILKGEADELAKKIADEWSYRLRMWQAVPSKTKGYCDVPQIKVFIPETLRITVGIILLTVVLHHTEGSPFFEVRNEYGILKEFFGERFLDACGKKRFSSRRANKSYLQGIEAIGENGQNAKGYMLAALARSHKGGIGSLPESTDVYLRDETFSGYKPEFILREMFERGIFGFIPDMLMKIYEEEDYLKLDVAQQTSIIKELGLTACQIEDITAMVDRALLHVRECAGLIMREGITSKKAVETILQKLVGDSAPAKQPEYLCLRIASGDRCVNADRASCLGCGYEIYTKSAFYTIVKEFRSLNCKRKTVSAIGAVRYQQIMKQVILPAVMEVLASMKRLYPEADNGILLDILEGGMNLECSD